MTTLVQIVHSFTDDFGVTLPIEFLEYVDGRYFHTKRSLDETGAPYYATREIHESEADHRIKKTLKPRNVAGID